jgi:hypothetical protein
MFFKLKNTISPLAPLLSLSNLRGARLSESDSDEEQPASVAHKIDSSKVLNTIQTTITKPLIESKPLHETNNSSGSDSTSESDTSEEEEESNHSDSDQDNNPKEESDFSLGTLMKKVKSTHSPGPNLHPSPKILQVALVESKVDVMECM